MKTEAVPQAVLGNLYMIQKAGYEAYLVGGCVRDLSMGKSPKDWDIATNALPEQIVALFPESFSDNAFGTVSIKNELAASDSEGKIVQVTPYRSEGEYSDNRRPDKVSFGVSLKEDLLRRDFTMNAIAWDPIKDKIEDPFGGLISIKSQEIKAVGAPIERFSEDALRLLRATRFVSELGFEIEKDTLQALKDKASTLSNISVERIRDEFTKLVMGNDPEKGMQLMLRTGLLEAAFPEFLVTVGIEQTQAHAYDVWTHLIKSLQHAAKKEASLEVRLAALLHDIGKPATRKPGNARHEWTFYGHEVVGARIAKAFLKRLKYPQKTTEKIVTLVRWHMFFSDTEQITLSAVRRMVANVGEENIWDLMTVRECDRIGTGRPKANPYRLRKYHAMIEEAMRDPVSVGMLKIDGKVLTNKVGIMPGPRMGNILAALLEEVLDDPTRNTEEYLEKRAGELAQLDDTTLAEMRARANKVRLEAEGEQVEEIRKKHGVA